MSKLPAKTFACRVMGHRWHFGVDGADVVWRCIRGCGEGGRTTRKDAEDARRFAAALERGAPGPPEGLLAALGGGVVRRPKE